uniref:RBR-type E3 ubiquitin transferase n=1 Tax=Mesocestoides corti TaxID=53468 RepID=A0A5K3FK76_MESCO
MDVINNLFSGNQRRPRFTPSVISSSSGSIRYKWPHRRKRANVQKNVQVEQALDADSLPGLLRVPADDVCAVCADDLEFVYALEKCGHRACLDCWRTFASTQVSSFAMAHITCLSCDRRLSRALTLQLLKPPRVPNPQASNPAASVEQQVSSDRLYQRYEDFLLHQCLLRDKHTRWCPRGCGYAVLAHGFRACPRLECQHPNCNGGAFCYKCRGPWSADGAEHVCPKRTGGGAGSGDPLTDNHRSLLSRLHQLLRLPTAAATSTAPEEAGDPGSVDGLIRQISERRFSTPTVPVHTAKSVDDADGDDDDDGDDTRESRGEDDAAAAQPGDVDISKIDLDLPDRVNGQVKPCPRCKTYLLKLDDGSCNHMSCFICGCEFCWLCLREVRDTHYLSPTGCTFWGRQRWPFKRRICAMLLAAFGTPFILAIVTFLALPGITVGFPAYLVYKVGGQLTGSKCKRGLVKTMAFLGGLLISPIIAAVVALFGIPLVLIYVYIFMPITLFSELKVRLNSETADTAIDPDVGFKINWERVGEAASQRDDAPTADSLPPSTTVDFAYEVSEDADSSDEA